MHRSYAGLILSSCHDGGAQPTQRPAAECGFPISSIPRTSHFVAIAIGIAIAIEKLREGHPGPSTVTPIQILRWGRELNVSYDSDSDADSDSVSTVLPKKLDEAVITVSTGTSVNDLAVCIVLPRA